MASKATKQRNLHVIHRTIREYAGKDLADFWLPYFHATAVRESALNHLIDAKHSADIEGAKEAFDRNKGSLYKNNPWVDAPSLWHTSRGLYQLMVPNHLHRVDPNYHPYSLYHPVVATLAAMRLVNKLIRSGASTMYELRAGWAGGPGYWDREGSDRRNARRSSQSSRFKSLGYDPSLIDVKVKEIPNVGVGPDSTDFAMINHISKMMGIMPIGENASNAEYMPSEWTEPAKKWEPGMDVDDEMDDLDDSVHPSNEQTGANPATKKKSLINLILLGLFGFLLGKNLIRK